MTTIQGVEVFNPTENESLVHGQVTSDVISKFGSFMTRKVVSTGLGIPPFKDMPLRSILENVDGYFDILSQSVDGSTVRHKWLLIPSILSIWELERIGIYGHVLGAEVQKIEGTKISYSEDINLYTNFRDKLQEASQQFLEANGWCIDDATKPRQYLLSNDTKSCPVLVDIDLRIETPTYPPATHDLL